MVEPPEDQQWSEVAVFNASTLQRLFSFGREKFSLGCYENGGIGGKRYFSGSASGIAIVEDEVYVGDQGDDCIRVFSFAGEHLREIRGDWMAPTVGALCFVHDRLYIIGRKKDQDRMLALTLEGKTLRSCAARDYLNVSEDRPNGGQGGYDYEWHNLEAMCHFGGELIVLSNSIIMGHLVALEGL